VVQVPYQGNFFSLGLNGGYVQYVADIGLGVEFDGRWVINVHVPAEYNDTLCGLCGDNDGNPNDDMTTPNGTYVGDLPNGAKIFGDSWIVDDPEEQNTSYVVPAA